MPIITSTNAKLPAPEVAVLKIGVAAAAVVLKIGAAVVLVLRADIDAACEGDM